MAQFTSIGSTVIETFRFTPRRKAKPLSTAGAGAATRSDRSCCAAVLPAHLPSGEKARSAADSLARGCAAEERCPHARHRRHQALVAAPVFDESPCRTRCSYRNMKLSRLALLSLAVAASTATAQQPQAPPRPACNQRRRTASWPLSAPIPSCGARCSRSSGSAAPPARRSHRFRRCQRVRARDVHPAD